MVRAVRRSRSGVLLVVPALVAGVLAGCSAEAAPEDERRPAVSGVLTGADGDPVPGEEVELWVHPAALGASVENAVLVEVDRAETDDDGSFALEAAVSDLTPHADAEGRVQVEVRVGEEAGTRTTVLLRRDAGIGETELVETAGVTVGAPQRSGETSP